MEKNQPIKEIAQRSETPVGRRIDVQSHGRYVSYSDFAKKEAENRELMEQIARLRRELEEAKSAIAGFHNGAYEAVDTLLHQAKSLSTLISGHEGITGL